MFHTATTRASARDGTPTVKRLDDRQKTVFKELVGGKGRVSYSGAVEMAAHGAT